MMEMNSGIRLLLSTAPNKTIPALGKQQSNRSNSGVVNEPNNEYDPSDTGRPT